MRVIVDQNEILVGGWFEFKVQRTKQKVTVREDVPDR